MPLNKILTRAEDKQPAQTPPLALPPSLLPPLPSRLLLRVLTMLTNLRGGVLRCTLAGPAARVYSRPVQAA